MLPCYLAAIFMNKRNNQYFYQQKIYISPVYQNLNYIHVISVFEYRIAWNWLLQQREHDKFYCNLNAYLY